MPDPEQPALECDVVMKGGITSGIVYPRAILRMKDTYRFRNVGGTSAGAIAAAVTAAAEFGRATGGFARLERVPDEIAQHLSELFQPTPALRPLYRVFAALTQRGLASGLLAAILAYLPWMLAALGLAALAAVAVWLGGTSPLVAAALGALVFLVLDVLVLAFCLYRDLMKRLPKYDFGLCPGPTQAGARFPGLSDWLAVLIEQCAGRTGALQGSDPLSFGDLKDAKPSITLRMMTSNLSLGTAHALPDLPDGNYFWNADELRRLLPGWVVASMVRKAGPPDRNSGLYRFPPPEQVPVILGVRMSLSFPLLIPAVPLHRIDFAVKGADGRPVMRRVLFSDGGITSNFPVHFFDRLLPSRPTFGVSLDDLEAEGLGRRVYMPMKAISQHRFPIQAPDTLPAFALAIVNTAREWQDRQLSALSGFRERVSHVYLRKNEGGLNLNMPSQTIDDLIGMGERAGLLMVGQPAPGDETAFDFPDHQWRRFLIGYAQLERLLEELRQSWGDPDDPHSFAATIRRTAEAPASYAQSSKHWRASVWQRIDDLVGLSRNTFGTRLRGDGRIPRHRARLRLVPELGDDEDPQESAAEDLPRAED
ncbi:MAG: patatin-like phospholipase family protein [Devosia sp.]|uniref:patatin-like phospholipase family protein n=1 Tax=Devosia sp. TaxID=1871048 RepID=UPI001AC79B4B|nr:patatin-like phospholipase family protein [Devosia sp.]MBN9315240.1 patatin-like phospholipase family protein [Devosia sp.]